MKARWLVAIVVAVILVFASVALAGDEEVGRTGEAAAAQLDEPEAIAADDENGGEPADEEAAPAAEENGDDEDQPAVEAEPYLRTQVLSDGRVVVLTPGAPSNWQRLPWSDEVLHSRPVDPKGLKPIHRRAGYEEVELPTFDEQGRKVYCYVGWTSTHRDGKRVWMRIRPGEVVETRYFKTVRRTISGELYFVSYAAVDVRFNRCANWGQVSFAKLARIYSNTIVRRGPERVVKTPVWYVQNTTTEVERTKRYAFYQTAPSSPGLPPANALFWYEEGLKREIVRGLFQYAARPRTTIHGSKSTSISLSEAYAQAKAEAEARGEAFIDFDAWLQQQMEQQQLLQQTDK